MSLNKLTAVPVIDGEQHVVATLSSTDLRGLNPSNFFKLRDTVFEFLESENRVGGVPVDQVKMLQGHAPVSEACDLMLKYGIHRVWIVDSEEVLTGVVSLSDVMMIFA
jgi:CBS domain-containing protein